MKKILILAFSILLTTVTFGQETEGNKVTPYIAAGLSMTNTTDFKAASYPSMEAGVMIDNISLAGVFGRNNLAEAKPEHIDNYWCEAKVAVSRPFGFVSGYAVLGVGTYIGVNGSLFIEYGGGIAKEFGSFGTFLQVSSWDGITYITPGFSVSF